MNNLLFWIGMTAFWIGMSWYWIEKEHPKFWVMWNFFFLGWTAANLFWAIFEVLG